MEDSKEGHKLEMFLSTILSYFMETMKGLRTEDEDLPVEKIFFRYFYAPFP